MMPASPSNRPSRRHSSGGASATMSMWPSRTGHIGAASSPRRAGERDVRSAGARLGRLGEMAGPMLFVVDHDESSLRVLLADLTRRFGDDFTVRGNSSPEAALETLQEIARANEPVALMLVDDRSSDFLARAHDLHPRAKRVLLVDRDYSSTSPAVQAMALGRADYHIVRPWASDEMLYGA